MSVKLMITDDQIKTWGELAAAATPGPWIGTDGCAVFADGYNLIADAFGETVRAPWSQPQCVANAAFIAAAREAVPVLVSEIETLRDMLCVSEQQNEALGNANVLAVDNDRLRAALCEACDIADAALMPNDRVSREWYEQHAPNRDFVRRIRELRDSAGVDPR